ncbi:MAG: hypothetical protein CML68_12875 [Rhodobacteraceae bacterium]|nr:hypothetical protein [Paracoccaceae bacterium]
MSDTADGPGRSDLVLPAEEGQLSRVLSWVQASGVLADVPPAIASRVELAAEELFLNLAHHAYADAPGEVRLSLQGSESAVTLVVEDDGTAFNPLDNSAEPDLDLEVEDRAIGGLGLHLVRKLSDRQTYDRDGGVNRLTLLFRIAPDNAPNATKADNPPKPTSTRTARRPVLLPFLLRFLLPLGLILTLSLVLAAGLNVLRLEREIQHAAQIRYDSVARELGDTIESSFGAGLSLSSNLAVQIAINRRAQLREGEIRYYVTGPDGQVVHASTGAGPLPSAVAALPGDADTLWHAQAPDEDVFLTGMPLTLDTAPIGTLVLVFPSRSLFEATATLRRDIAIVAPLIALISLPIIALIALMVAVPLHRRFHHMADVMHDLADGTDAPVARSDGALVHAAAAISARLGRSTAETGS